MFLFFLIVRHNSSFVLCTYFYFHQFYFLRIDFETWGRYFRDLNTLSSRVLGIYLHFCSADNTCFNKTLLKFLTMAISGSIRLKLLFNSLISSASEFIVFSVLSWLSGINQSIMTCLVPSMFLLCIIRP